MLSFTLMLISVLVGIVVAKMVVTSVFMAVYRVAFAIYYFVKNENVDYKALVLKGTIIRPIQNMGDPRFSQGAPIKKSA
jgi:hypothetical protein